MTNKPLNDTIHRVTQRVIANSRDSRAAYLDLMDRESDRQITRGTLSCSNLAHAFAGAEEGVWRHMIDTHATPAQVGRMAAEAGVGRVVLTHLAPGALLDVPDSTYTEGVTEHFSGPVLVATDGMLVAI